jgi:hypothetical protein
MEKKQTSLGGGDSEFSSIKRVLKPRIKDPQNCARLRLLPLIVQDL